jgi:hypothetical protein
MQRTDGGSVMKKWAMVALVLGLAGCSTDNARSLSRDYRNLINEAVDGLMMTTNETRALYVRAKIFKPFQERMSVIDKRCDTWAQNTEDKLVVEDLVQCESVMILLAEKAINRRRVELEINRLKNLLAAKVQDETERRRAIGDANPVDPEKDWPNLNSLAKGEGMNSLVNNLLGAENRGSKIEQLWKAIHEQEAWNKHKPKNFADLDKLFNDRVAALGMQAKK